MASTLKNRLAALEANMPQDNNHDYRHVITCEENDRIVSRYYRDGVEITRREYERECKPQPGEKINVIITELDENHNLHTLENG